MYRDILSYFFPVFSILALSSQALIVYTIIRHSPKSFQVMKYVLYITSFFQVVHILMSYLTQLRQVSHLTPMELWCYGPIRHFEAYVGYCCYHTLQSAAQISSLSVFVNIYFKYEAARCINPPRSRMVVVVLLILTLVIASISLEITSIVTYSLPIEIRQMFLVKNENTTLYSSVGIINMNFWPMRTNFYIMASTVAMIPAVGMFLKRRISWHLKSTMDRLSQFNKSQHQTFVNGLTLQAFLPIIFYVPIFSSMLYVMVTKTELTFQQYFIFVVPALPCLVDPYITLYFVKPYRNQAKVWMGIEKKSTINVVAYSSRVH